MTIIDPPHNVNICTLIDDMIRQLGMLRSAVERIQIGSGFFITESTESDLRFYDKWRMIAWANGILQLPKKEYCVVKTIWSGKNHEAELLDIEEAVWQKEINKTGKMIERHTICVRVANAQKKMRNAACPYRIESFKTQSSREIQGWRIVSVKLTKKD